MTAVAPASLATRTRAMAADPAVAAFCAVLALSTVLRFFISGGQPLWLDETWTAGIVAQGDFADFARRAYADVNAPLYYLVTHLWQAVAGDSNVALRAPSAIFGAAAPLLIAFTRVPGVSLRARLAWASLLALWVPGLWFSGEARCYALLVLVCTAQTLAFVRLLEAPGLRRAGLWAGLASLAILTQYHAAVLAGLQGLAYLAWSRRRAVETWPAALLFVPAFAWMGWHLPTLAAFARPEAAWYSRLTPGDLVGVVAFPFGSIALIAQFAAVAVTAILIGRLRPVAAAEAAPNARAFAPLWIAFAVAVAATAFVVALGFVRPSFTLRYLSGFTPALLIAPALAAMALARRWALVYPALAAILLLQATPWALGELRQGSRLYSWEQASAELMQTEPRRLVFLWDNPVGRILSEDQLGALGGFFVRRDGRPVEIRAIVPVAGEDPNAAILAAAAGEERTAVIWAYDVNVPGTEAVAFPPRLDPDAGFRCRQYGAGPIGVLGCVRGPGAP